MCNWFIVILSFYLEFVYTNANAPVVCIDAVRCVEGIYRSGNDVDIYEAFLGVPYAQPPIGNLRFENPRPAEPWIGTLLAKEPHTECLQRNYFAYPFTTTGVEDCLYLNVYRPASEHIDNDEIRTTAVAVAIQYSGEKLPVLFYIHGGGFFYGSPNPEFFGPEYFMDTNEAILVIPAYRLGPFGFLSTDDVYMPGNFGLKDQNLALKWVQSHISAFGGDPSRVTIFGHSAGGISVHLQMLSPASRGLFRNAILVSGVGGTKSIQPIVQKPQTIKFAMAAGITNASELSSAELVNALRTLPADQLVQASDALKVWYVYPFENFRPTIEAESWPDPFLTTNVRELLEKAPPRTVPWIAGDVTAKGEGIVIALRLAGDPVLQAEFNANFDELFKLILELPAAEKPEEVNVLVDRLVTEYMNGVYMLNNDTLSGFLEILGDANFYYPLYKTIVDNVKPCIGGRIPTGYMIFDYRGPYSYTEFFTGNMNNLGTVHYDDTLFLFTVQQIAPFGYFKSSPAAELVKRYVDLYVEFAKTGNVEVFSQIKNCTKDLLAEQGFCDYLSIFKDTEPFHVDNAWNIERMQLWEHIYTTFF